jgi:hypothetical protein
LGRGEDRRRIAWVKWRDVCLSKESGGLGVRQPREFNTALLGKWCWWLLVDRLGMWYRVLVARYGESEGRVLSGGGGRSRVFRTR